jgi:hypothetical protein
MQALRFFRAVTDCIRTTVGEHLGRISVANLKWAHARLESGKARGKLVLKAF